MFKKGYYRSIPIWFNVETNEMKGRNLFYDILVDINIWIDVNIINVDVFPILLEDE